MNSAVKRCNQGVLAGETKDQGGTGPLSREKPRL